MTGSKHPKTSRPSDKDLEQNPGIGASKGLMRREGPALIQGENTFEGDVENDTTAQGAVHPRQIGRRNK